MLCNFSCEQTVPTKRLALLDAATVSQSLHEFYIFRVPVMQTMTIKTLPTSFAVNSFELPLF